MKPTSRSATRFALARTNAPARWLAVSLLCGSFACAAPASREQAAGLPAAQSDAAIRPHVVVAPATVAPNVSADERARFERAAEYSAERSGHVVLVVKGDAVVFTAGQNGYDVEAPHPLHSASESFWGVLAAAADADGLLDLDEPVSRTVPEFAADPRRGEIRLRELLNFTSGLERGMHTVDAEGASDLYERSLQLTLISPPGKRFRYGAGQLYLFALIVSRKVQDRFDDPVAFLEDRILDRIGLETDDWKRDDAGNPDVAFGAKVAAAEWAKWGMLLRDRGIFQGREIVPAAAVEAVFQGSKPAPEFGLTLWLNRSEQESGRFYPGALPDLVLAAGVGNQRLYVLPSQDLVVVRFGDRDQHWSDEAFLSRLTVAPPLAAN